MARALPAARDRADLIADAVGEALRSRGADAARPTPEIEPASEAPALALALDAYANLRPADARASLEALLARADANGARGLERPQLLDALLTLSLSCRALGDAAAADAALDRALAIEPSLTPSLTQYPPTLVEAVEARRTATAGIVPGTVVLGPLPIGAHLFVDARVVASTTARLELPRGPHLLRVEARDRVAWSARVELGDAAIDVAPELPPDGASVLREPGARGERRDEALDLAARSLGARAFVVDVSVHGALVTLSAHDFARDRRATVTLAAGTSADELASELLRQLEPLRATRPLGQRGGPSLVPWLVAAGGAVAIAVTVVAIVLTTSGTTGPSGFNVHGER